MLSDEEVQEAWENYQQGFNLPPTNSDKEKRFYVEIVDLVVPEYGVIIKWKGGRPVCYFNDNDELFALQAAVTVPFHTNTNSIWPK